MSEEKKNMDEKLSVTESSKGERLRLAREALGFDVSEIAAKLYFETRFILALENDDYSIFAGSAYLYGYMRAYVKLLGLPLDEFVCDLKNIEDENEVNLENIGENISYQPALRAERKKWVLPTMIGLLLAVIAVAGFVLMSGSDSAKADSIASLTETGNQAGKELRRISVPLAREAPADIAIAETNIEITTGPTINEADSEKADREALVNQDVSAEVARPRLLLEYKTDSWTDIRDADGKRLVYRMVEKGNRLELDSSPTYSILLGYSPGVNVSWNDQPFSLSEYERENIAYFVVGEKNKTSSVTIARD